MCFHVVAVAIVIAPALSALSADVLRSVDAIPAHIAGRFRDPAGFQRSASGQYFVFDRRSQIVYGITARFTVATYLLGEATAVTRDDSESRRLEDHEATDFSLAAIRVLRGFVMTGAAKMHERSKAVGKPHRIA